MGRFVIESKNKRVMASVLVIMKRWEGLRLQPGEVIKRKILLLILNGIWMAYRRKQKSGIAMIWIAAESYIRQESPTRYIDLARRMCQLHLPLIKSFGYEVRIVEDDEKYWLYKSERSTVSEAVILLGVQVSDTHIEAAQRVRELLFSETKLLPEMHRHKSKKKKRRTNKSTP